MSFTTLKRVFRLGFTNFWRNRWLSAAGTFVMTLTLFIISIFAILSLVVITTTNAVKEKVDMIVYFDDAASDAQIQRLQGDVLTLPQVKTVRYVSKEEALQEFLSRSTSERIRSLVSSENNPLPRSLQVKTTDPEDLDLVANFIQQSPENPVIRRISYLENRDVIQKLLSITKFVNRMGVILSAIFIAISFLVIANTIRLAIFARREELEVMRLVGASDAFVKLPFYVEAILYGMIAAVFTMLLIELGLGAISPMVARYLGDVSLNLSSFFHQYFFPVFALQIAVGALIAIISTAFTARRFIRT
jgi:cell division transport system permease protein